MKFRKQTYILVISAFSIWFAIFISFTLRSKSHTTVEQSKLTKTLIAPTFSPTPVPIIMLSPTLTPSTTPTPTASPESTVENYKIIDPGFNYNSYEHDHNYESEIKSSAIRSPIDNAQVESADSTEENENELNNYEIDKPQPTRQRIISGGLAHVISDNANLQFSADQSSKIIRQVEFGEVFLLIKKEPLGSWYRVYDNQTKSEGWIHKNNIKLE